MTEVEGAVQALSESVDAVSNSEADLINDKPQLDIKTATATTIAEAAAAEAVENSETVVEAEQAEYKQAEAIESIADGDELQEQNVEHEAIVKEKETQNLIEPAKKMAQEKEIVQEQQSSEKENETEAISTTAAAAATTTTTATTATNSAKAAAATTKTTATKEKSELEDVETTATKENGKTASEEEEAEERRKEQTSTTAATETEKAVVEKVVTADVDDEVVTTTTATVKAAVAVNSNCSNEAAAIAENHVAVKPAAETNETADDIAMDDQEEDQPDSSSITMSKTALAETDNNGLGNSTSQKLNDTNSSSCSSVVVLGDDSDVEMCEVPNKSEIEKAEIEHEQPLEEDEHIVNMHKSEIMDDPLLGDGDVSISQEENLDDIKKSISVCSDSDGAVVINSDSEPETCTKNTTKNRSGILYLHTLNQLEQQQQQQTTPQQQQQAAAAAAAVANKDEQQKKSAASQLANNNNANNLDDDDDDDDCVVIEDSSTAPAHCVNDVNKRKSIVLDNGLNHNQPPNKRQRCLGSNMQTTEQMRRDTNAYPVSISSGNATATAVAAAVAAATAAMNNANTNNLINTAATGPPKLVPMSSANNTTAAAMAAVNNAASGANTIMPVMIGGMSGSATLLPGLTDDMFVLEAPSFIVPYIYEKPPPDNLKNICREIEQKFKLTKEDMAEADKSDEFDMMTEQNKDEKSAEAAAAAATATSTTTTTTTTTKPTVDTKKKKRTRGADDPDESWSEESDEDDDEDDDDDSDVGIRTKVLIKEASDDLTALKGAIKPATAIVQSVTVSTVNVTTGGAPETGITFGKTSCDNYFESPLGRFFMDIGVGLVQEYVQSDLIRLQKRKMRKSLGKNITEYERAISALSGNLEASKKKNSPFKFTLKRCEFCNFKSESALAMANHYETPHMNGIMYKCNFCTYEIRNSTEIVYHMEAMHNIKARLIKALPYHQCPNCGFEDNGKAKLARHQPVCAKKFRPELNLVPPADWEAPAKIPRIKPRHGLVGTATAYQAMAAQAAAQKAALASIQQQQQHVSQARGINAATIAAQNANKLRGRPPSVGINSKTPSGVGILPNNNTIVTPNILRGGTAQVRAPMPANVVLSNTYQLAGAQLLQVHKTYQVLHFV